jgi:hypothetical protein
LFTENILISIIQDWIKKVINFLTRSTRREALAGIWTRDLCLTKATLCQAELPRRYDVNQISWRVSLRLFSKK